MKIFDTNGREYRCDLAPHDFDMLIRIVRQPKPSVTVMFAVWDAVHPSRTITLLIPDINIGLTQQEALRERPSVIPRGRNVR